MVIDTAIAAEDFCYILMLISYKTDYLDRQLPTHTGHRYFITERPVPHGKLTVDSSELTGTPRQSRTVVYIGLALS